MPHYTPDDLPPLVTLGDPLLAQPCAPLDPKRIRKRAFQARLALLRVGLEHHGANGIAAPQLGWFERFLLMRDPGGTGGLVYWINPEIVQASEEQVWYWEGCLSVPGYKGYIARSAAIAVRGYNEHGEPVSREFADWEAHLFQHEYDHLDGVLFPYRAADPRHVVCAEALEQRDAWPADWPAPGAREAPIRAFRAPGE
ncbi:MAG TPA: peptide deformylase [bacterium]|nr:peptide deformylase [bacterium]